MYKTLSAYLKSTYGGKIRKICIDGGFSCPNRDGVCGHGGCIYCGERGAGEHINGSLDIAEQVKAGLRDIRADGFIAYFQNFTNTYADLDTLRLRYDAALIDDRIVALAVGTRPDCIDEGVCELLSSYKSKVDVWVELGLQTASDEVATRINRGYKTEIYFRAAELLHSYGIPFVTHLMVGLPGEKPSDIDASIEAVRKARSWGVKIHSTYVMEGTLLADMYREKLYTPPTFDEYVESAARILASLGDSVIVHRITGDCPEGLLVAPEWSRDKSRVISAIQSRLAELESSGAGF